MLPSAKYTNNDLIHATTASQLRIVLLLRASMSTTVRISNSGD